MDRALLTDFMTDAPTEVLAPIVESPVKKPKSDHVDGPPGLMVDIDVSEMPKSDLVDGPPGLMDDGHQSDEEEGHQSGDEATLRVAEHLVGGAVLGEGGNADDGGKVIAGILVASTPGQPAVFVPGIEFVAPVVLLFIEYLFNSQPAWKTNSSPGRVWPSHEKVQAVGWKHREWTIKFLTCAVHNVHTPKLSLI